MNDFAMALLLILTATNLALAIEHRIRAVRVARALAIRVERTQQATTRAEEDARAAQLQSIADVAQATHSDVAEVKGDVKDVKNAVAGTESTKAEGKHG